MSRDIRAPNANELFSAGTTGRATLNDPQGGQALVTVIGGGNRDLDAEKADTKTFGVVIATCGRNTADVTVT